MAGQKDGYKGETSKRRSLNVSQQISSEEQPTTKTLRAGIFGGGHTIFWRPREIL